MPPPCTAWTSGPDVSRAEQVLGTVLTWNNDQIRHHAVDRLASNPRSLADCPWNARMEAAHPVIRGEWDRFVEAGGTLPHLEDLIAEHQGNEGAWRAGLLVSKGRPATRLAERFPLTVAALAQIPGLWSALWSVFEPGTELPEHTGPNAGMLRYHLGVDCGADSALALGGTVIAYRDGSGVLFDDTAPHSAWNRGPTSRVTLFCEVIRPADWPARWANRMVQRMLSLDHRFQQAPRRADEWDWALNGG